MIATISVFFTFLVGSRNPLIVFGIGIPEPRVVFWSCLTLTEIIIIRVISRRRFEKIKLTKTLGLLLILPIALIFVRLIYEFNSGAPTRNIEELISLLVLLTATVLIGPLSSAEYFRLFWKIIIVVFTFFLILSLFVGAKGPDMYFDALDMGRIIFARYMAIGAVITIYWSFRINNRWLLILGFGFVLGTFLAGSRGQVVSLLVIAIIGLIFMKKRLQLLAFLGSSALLLAFFTFGPWRFQVLRIRYVDLSPVYTAGRDKIWTEKIKTLESNSGQILTGVKNEQSDNAHNLLLDTLLNGGVVTLTLMLLILIIWTLLVFKNRQYLGETALPVLLVVLIFVGSQFSGTFYENAMIWFFYLVAIFQISITLGKQSKKIYSPVISNN